jgi:uncharacterized protein YdhG (YjbR/CyaY superfamily)
MKKHDKNIDEYIALFPNNTKDILKKIRATIKDAAPEATEYISYQMPTYKLKGKNLIHFAAFKSHIGIYPAGAYLEDEIPEVAKYRTGKGTLQFTFTEEFPYELLKEIVKFRAKELEKK